MIKLELVGLLEGEIYVASKVKKGSRFVLSLPRGRSHLASISHADSLHNSTNSQQPLFASKRNMYIQEASLWSKKDVRTGGGEEGADQQSNENLVLIVDDNSDIQKYRNLLWVTLQQIFFCWATEAGRKILLALKILRQIV